MKRYRHYLKKILYICLACVMLFALVKGIGLPSENGRLPIGWLAVLDDTWEVERENVQDKKSISYSYVLPERLPGDVLLSVESFWSALRVYLDGQLLYSYEDPYLEKGTVRHWIDLPYDSSGKKLTIQYLSSENGSAHDYSGDVYLGEKNAVMGRFLSEHLYAGFFTVSMWLMSVGLYICSIFFKKRLSAAGYKSVKYLSAFIFLTGLWVVTDSQLLQLFTGKMGLMLLVSFLSFMFMPLLLVLYIKEMLLHEKRGLELLLLLYQLCIAFVCISYIFRLMPMTVPLVAQHILVVVTIAVVIRNGIVDIKKYHNNDMYPVLSGFGIFSAFGLLALVLFYTRPGSAYSIAFSVGMFLFVVCLAYGAFKKLYYNMKINESIAIYKRIAYRDLMTDLGNRSAFIKEQERTKEVKNMAYIVFDVNDLKKVNDTYGHQEGDRLITDTARCIRGVFENEGKCFRIGGDEFAVVLREHSEKEILGKLDLFNKRLAKINEARKISLQIAYGYSTGMGTEKDAETLFREADYHMYVRKKNMKEIQHGQTEK